MILGPSPRWARGATATLGGIAALALLAGALTGPDFGWYDTWARALTAGSFASIDTGTRSPGGVPFIQWSHGPGAFFAAFRGLSPDGLSAEQAAFAAGWLSALVFWVLLSAALYRVAAGDAAAALLGLAVLAVATHAGFYSRAHASESLTLAPLGILAWQSVRARRTELRDLAAIGLAIACLLTLRNYYVVYALPALVRCGDRATEGDRGDRVRALAVLCAPILLALPQVLLVNRWMTGAWLGSPYSFGDEGFASFAWGAPKVLTVLFHPWHGAFAYHPAYAVGIGLLVFAVVVLRGTERRVAGAALTAVLVNIYVQAAWYVWWLGTGTFGMRGLVPVAVPTAIVLTAAVARGRARVRTPLLLVIVAASVWSFALLRMGNTQYLTWSDLLASVPRSLLEAGTPAGIGWLACGALAGVALIVVWAGPRALARPTAAVAAALTGLVAAWLGPLGAGFDRQDDGGTLLGAGLALVIVGGLRLAWTAARDPGPGVHPAPEPEVVPLASWGLAVALLCASLLFFRLAWSVEVTGVRPELGDQSIAAFAEHEVLASYGEYLWVEGFEDDKQALAGFLRRHGLLD